MEDEDREDTDLRSGQVHRFFRVMQFVPRAQRGVFKSVD